MRTLLSALLVLLLAGSFFALLPRINARFLIPLFAIITLGVLVRSWWRRRKS